MIKLCESKWKKSCLIKLALSQTNETHNALLVNLSTPLEIPTHNENDSMAIVRSVRKDSATELKSAFNPN